MNDLAPVAIATDKPQRALCLGFVICLLVMCVLWLASRDRP